MAWFALEIGDVSRAERWAEEALRIPHVVKQIPWRIPGFPPDVHEVHYANIALGRIALDRGEDQEAERRLALAASILNGYSGTPDFTLAQEILRRGRIDPVRSYLLACRTSWVFGEQHVDRWLQAIEVSDVPDLDPWRSTRPSLRLILRSLRSRSIGREHGSA